MATNIAPISALINVHFVMPLLLQLSNYFSRRFLVPERLGDTAEKGTKTFNLAAL